VAATGDVSILGEEVPFLRAPELGKDEGDRYALFETSAEQASVFEHCARALERGITRGPHQLPLIGAGDWNDGMNRVGARGRGESVWLGWFAISVMHGFADLAVSAERETLATKWTARAEELRMAIEKAAWDGGWYLRAFDDDGHPWGSASCDECKIDSIAQSWAALSGAGDPDRTRLALDAVERELVREDDRLILLLWPPFHEALRDPGYIKAYPPGIRENGGQYSHAAAWRGLSLAACGDGDGAWRVFDLMNPIRRTENERDLERYRAEPYVLAADIASVAPHIGRGGWSWYTGAAAWTWRLGVEGILGVQLSGGAVRIEPCLPKSWGAAAVTIQGPSGSLAISIEDPGHLGHGTVTISVDGTPVEGTMVAFPSDGTVRNVRVQLTTKSRFRPEPYPASDEQKP
jgi:cyclic beta-1,2-glucan synthetase